MPINPIFYHSGGRIHDADDPNATTPVEPEGWYFWTETWADYVGPYLTRDKAALELIRYGESL